MSQFKRITILAGILLVLACVYLLWVPGSSQSTEDLQLLAKQQYDAADFKQAEATANTVLKTDANNPFMLLIAGGAAEKQQRPNRAIDYLVRLPQSAPTWHKAQYLLATIYDRQLSQFSKAEQCYRAVLQDFPKHVEANTQLASLMALTGRKQDAIPYILQLVQQTVDTDLFILLLREDGVIQNPDRLQQAMHADPQDPLPYLGLSWLATQRSDYQIAIDHLNKALELDPQNAIAWSRKGELLIDQQRFPEAFQWARDVPLAAHQYPQTWISQGQLAEKIGQEKQAVRCYLEAARLTPELRAVNAKLSSLLQKHGAMNDAEMFRERLSQLQHLTDLHNQTFFSAKQPAFENLINLIEASHQVGRLWEAIHLANLAATIHPNHPQLQEQRRTLAPYLNTLPLIVTAPEWNHADNIDLSAYRLPDFSTSPIATRSQQKIESDEIQLTDIATELSLDFHYHNGTENGIQRKLYEFSGGGIGALDYDLDGWPDLYFTQGQPILGRQSDRLDALFRNRFGQRFQRVESAARVHEAGFGQGVSHGDYNSDGFPDLYIATTSTNRLFLNNGDGTFSSHEIPQAEAWTTSCLMADLNGDTHPDLYDVNYMKGKDLFSRVCEYSDGEPQLCSPAGFDAAIDRLLLSNGSGTFLNQTEQIMPSPPAGKGLGILAWDSTQSGQLSIFVANDTTANFLYQPSQSTNAFQLDENALQNGVAYNAQGKAEACMGVALADVDNNSLFDLHVTNYYNESNTLYLQSEQDFFIDQTQTYQLEVPTLPFLSFGTQFTDFNADGLPELFVTSGHLDDQTRNGIPLKMNPQLFQSGLKEFTQLPQSSSYFQNKWIGRSACLIDYDRDGISEIAVGHLYDAYALLKNTSATQNQSVTLKLVGTSSARIPIGTTVIATIDGQQKYFQLTAGSGYQASNQFEIMIGCGNNDAIEQLELRWPSRNIQTWNGVPVGATYLLIEGSPEYRKLSP